MNDYPASLYLHELLFFVYLFSVGNMAPFSVRDEQHLPDISGMSNASFDHTHTTVQESSCTSAGAGSSHMTTSSIDNSQQRGHLTAAAMSPISNVARLNPIQNFVSPASNASVVAYRSDVSIDRSDISDRKPAATVGPSIDDLDEQTWPDNDNEPHRSHSHELLLIETLVVTKDVDTSGDSYNLPNRTIRPGMNKASSGNDTSKLNTSKIGHRRSQTTPNIPSFVDDFDYCKYNDVGSSTSRNSHFIPFFGSVLDPDIHATLNPIVNDPDTGEFFSNYGSTDPEEGLIPLLKSEQSGHEEPPRLMFGRRRPVDDMVDSVFSSVRSMSTADFQAEINDCDKYSSSPALSRGES